MEKREHSKKVLHHLKKLRQLGIVVEGIELSEDVVKETAVPPYLQTHKLGRLAFTPDKRSIRISKIVVTQTIGIGTFV